MPVNLKPLTYWVIHENYSVRFKSRTPEKVQGVVSNAEGDEVEFDYYPDSMQIELPDRIITVNEGGWVQNTEMKSTDATNDLMEPYE